MVKSSKSSGEMNLYLVTDTFLSQSISPVQYFLPTRMTGNLSILRVWMRVIASKNSSSVPNPPGITTNPCAYLTNITLRTKK